MKAKAARIELGDKVLVKVLAFKGKHKLADKFEENIYEVIDQPHKDIPVYIVRSSDGVRKTLHRNHLLPLGNKIEDETTLERPVPRPRKPRSVGTIKTVDHEVKEKEVNQLSWKNMEELSDSEDEYTLVNSNSKRPAGHKQEREFIHIEETNAENLDNRDPEKEDGNIVHPVVAGVDELPVEHTESDVETEVPDVSVVDEMENQQFRRSTRVKKPPDRYMVGQQQNVFDKHQLQKLIQMHSENTRLTSKLLNAVLQ